MSRSRPRQRVRVRNSWKRRNPSVEPLEGRTLLSVNVLTFHNDLARDGWNANEVMLTPANVNQSTFGKLFSYPVDGQTYAQPLYVSGLNMGTLGTHNVVFVETQNDSVYAFDADSNTGANGGLLWHVSLGTAAATPNTIFGNRYGPYHDIDPQVGITGTPVIDLASNTMYVDAFTNDGGGHYSHHIHALDITTGAEKFGGPVLVQASVPGSGDSSVNGTINFSSQFALQRPALTLFNGTLYVIYTGYADTDPYHGWVLGFNPSNLHLTSAFLTTPNGNEGGIWQSGNGLSSDGTSLYVMTGNGTFEETLTAGGFPSGNDYGDSFLRFTAGASSLTVSDYFTPLNQQSLSNADEDLGSGGAMVLPNSVGSAAHPHLLVGTGKEGKIYLVDRDNMGKFSPTTDHVVQELPSAVGGTWSNPAYANGVIYYHGEGDFLKAFSISNGLLNPVPVQGTVRFGFPGATPSVSSNGAANGIVWEIQSGSTEILRAYNAANVSQELYDSNQNAPRDALTPFPTTAIPTPQKFMTPTIADGHVFVGTNDQLAVFGLFTAPPTRPNPPSNLAAVAQSASQIKLTWFDNSNNESAFKIERSTDGMNFAVVGTASVNATTFTDSNLNAGTKYFYRVRATNVAGDSIPSNVASATTGASTTPVDWYKFDETTGTTAADSAGGNTGTLVGSPAPERVPGRVGPEALNFIGNGVYNSTANQSAVNVSRDLSSVLGGTATLTAWVRTLQVGNNASGQEPGITGVEQASGGNDIRWGSLDASGHIGLQAGDGASIVSTVPINDGQWHHIAITRDATTGQVKLYIDGNLNVTGTSATGLKTSRFFTIGAVTDVASDGVTRTGADYFNGSLDDVRIFNSALGATDVAALAKVPAAPVNLTARVISATVIQLNWTNVSSFAAGVKIERKAGAGGTYVQIGQVGAGVTSFNDNSLQAGVQYVYRVRATAPAGDSAYSNEAGTVSLRPNVVGRFTFYNRSIFDGQNGSSNIADSRAIATDKQALLPGQIATFANYTSYDKGINGINIDLANFTATPSGADFTFKIGNNNSPSTWVNAPAPLAVNIYPGQGINGTNRITILWADGSIKNTWLQVTMLADATTGLAAPDVFYWGNEVGETGNSTTDANVTADDVAAVRANFLSSPNRAPVTDRYDFNRDGVVDATDVNLAQNNQRAGAQALQLINLTGSPPASTGTITGRLFQDSNGNGVWDPGEIGIAGWTMYVDYNNNSRLDAGEPTTTTATAGFYTFNNIRTGEQIVRQLPQSGWVQTTPLNNWGVHAVVVTGRSVTAPFTGIRRSSSPPPPPPPPPGNTASISGTVFNDVNADNRFDAGDVVLANWHVFADLNGNGVQDAGEPGAVTNSSGNYTIGNLAAGSYLIRAAVPAGWRQTLPAGNAALPVALGSGQAIIGKSFGETQKAYITGHVFDDVNGDGLSSKGEPGLGNWRVFLDLNNDGIWESNEESALTDSSGNWFMGDLLPGNYELRVVQQGGWRLTAPSKGFIPVTTSNASIGVAVNFGEQRIG